VGAHGGEEEVSDHNAKLSAWDKVKGIIGTVAPGLATGLGGPLAGAAVSFITQALGMKPDEEDQAIAALQNNPEAILKLKLAEIDYQKFLKEGDIKLTELDVKDRESARALAIAKGLFPQVSLSMVYTVGYFSLVFGLLSGWLDLPDGTTVQNLMNTLVAMMTGAQLQIMNFWFGSSSGSQAKDHKLAEK
jgi:hypothetical protein